MALENEREERVRREREEEELRREEERLVVGDYLNSIIIKSPPPPPLPNKQKNAYNILKVNKIYALWSLCECIMYMN